MSSFESRSNSNQSLPAGTRLEQFVIERVLGSGGFGVTYLATDSRLNRQVVIKENLPAQFCFRDPASLTVAPRHTHGEDAANFDWSLENFSKEAAMLASLDHPGIVRVLHSFEALGTAYFVMPFVDGVAFDELIQERREKSHPFSEDELRGLLDRMLACLHHLHERGIYHRDIKPGNILITSEGIPVLIDFGSARQLLGELSMTVIESPGYTPFEQLQSRGNIGPWSDLYALGGTLVKAITGEAPPKATDRAFDDPFKPLVDRPELSESFTSVFLGSLDHALKSRPADRWQSSQDWRSALHPKVQAVVEAPEIQLTPTAAAARNPAATPVQERKLVPKSEERDFLLTSDTSIRMCWIPPGKFLMGSWRDELGRDENETQHHVGISRGFWMGKYPVTQLQWLEVTGERPSGFGSPGIMATWFGDSQKDDSWHDHPVEQVSWWDICGNLRGEGGFLGKINNHAEDGWSFDLPTEAEWEYACRAGTEKALNHAENLTSETGTCNCLDQVAWYGGNSGFCSHPVGRKIPNAWGLHDMHGNIAEWCADFGGAYPNGLLTDPIGPDSGTCRVYRGGSWINGPRDCRSARRVWVTPECRIRSLGFRLVLVPSSPSKASRSSDSLRTR